ncbi:MAG TPA: hydrolase [Gemmatimonadales bacterium]
MPHPPFTPAWWIPGPHAQTLWGKFFRRMPRMPWSVERWDTPDGDFVDLHRVHAADPRAPRLLLLHGLEGGPRSHYVGGIMSEAIERGWGADFLVFRSCGPELNLAPRFYHSGETGDLAFVIDRLLAEHPDSPLVLAGVSLGGNVLLKYLGERGDDLPSAVRAAATVSVPYDLDRGCRHISQGFSRVYERHFLRTLRRKAIAKLAQHPRILDAGRMAAARTLYEFDDVVTAPVHGFESAADYYARSSSLRFLHGIGRPTLLLSAVDDPFLPAPVLDEVREVARDNRALHLEFVPRGGHVGFVGGRLPWRPDYWAERRVVRFLADALDAGAAAAPVAAHAPHAAQAAHPPPHATAAMGAIRG